MAAEKGLLDLSVTVGTSSFSAKGETKVVLDAYADFKAFVREGAESSSLDDGNGGGENGDGSSGAKRKPPPPKRTTNLPLKPYLEQFDLPGNKQKATALLAWSAERGEKAALTFAEVEKLWKKTPFKAPGNLARDLRNAEKEGWLDSVGKSGSPEATFCINGYGEGIVAGWAKKPADK